jgi:hypothetical protein
VITDPTQYYPLGIYKDWVHQICDLGARRVKNVNAPSFDFVPVEC